MSHIFCGYKDGYIDEPGAYYAQPDKKSFFGFSFVTTLFYQTPRVLGLDRYPSLLDHDIDRYRTNQSDLQLWRTSRVMKLPKELIRCKEVSC